MGIRFFILFIVSAMFTLSAQGAKKVQKFESLPAKKVPAQKTKRIKAAPLEKPMSSRLREQRQQMEMETEERIAQELERARMEDERVRREKLFKEQFEQKPVEKAFVSNADGMSAVEYTKEELNAEDLYYVSFMGGMLNYPQVNNIDSVNGAGGVSVGMALPYNFWVEGSFLYSFQETDIKRLTGSSTEDVDHFGLSVVGNYHFDFNFIPQWLTPRAGVAMTYTGRRYNGGDNSSNAFDMGLVAGADVTVASSVSLGLEYRYMTNVDYEKKEGATTQDVVQQQLATGNQVKNLETFDYQLLMLNTKVSF